MWLICTSCGSEENPRKRLRKCSLCTGRLVRLESADGQLARSTFICPGDPGRYGSVLMGWPLDWNVRPPR